MTESSGQKADLTAWLSVVAGMIGAMMATLDISIVNASLPTIQGEVGASGSEGTWISTAYLVAEIIMIPMAGWLERALGLRALLLVCTTGFTLCSVWCGLASTLPEMILGRIGQGFTGGALIPTALSIIAKRLPPSQQPIGTAIFGATAVLGPVLGPVLGGWLTENISWHYAFFINLPIGVGLLALLLIALPADKADVSQFLEADLLGIAGLVLGLGCLTTALEEGQRERWFESTLIVQLSAASALGFVLLVAGQFVAKRPVIRLRILLERQFGGIFVMTLMVGAAAYGFLYLIPQFLSAVPGYNSEQSGFVAAVSGVPTILMLGVFPFLVKHLDVRLAVALGLLLYSISCFLQSNLTPVSAGGDFFVGQLLRGFGLFFTIFFLNQAAALSVAPEYADDASGLFNAARNLGGSIGLAIIATLQDRRVDLHFSRLAEAIPANSERVQEAMRSTTLPELNNALMGQALVITYSDLFWLFAVALLGTIPFVMMMRPIKTDRE
jgi:MFS transporter, DHA2 family, multidrug resistance protein